MLIEFTVGNYRSFRNAVTLSMQAADIASRPATLDAQNVFQVGETRLLTSAAIYGANASGKTNFIRAYSFFHEFVQRSTQMRYAKGGTFVEPYLLHSDTENQPSHFEIVFFQAGTQYRYGFEATREAVTREWLYALGKKREAMLFERNYQEVAVNARAFREGRGLEPRTRKDALFLTVAHQFNGAVASTVLAWFDRNRIYIGGREPYELSRAAHFFAESDQRDAVAALIRALDTGIDSIHYERTRDSSAEPDDEQDKELWKALTTVTSALREALPDSELHDDIITVGTSHKKYDNDGKVVGEVQFEMGTHESAGTQRLFSLAFDILGALHEGGVLCIDELDARIHPNLVIELIRLFNSTTTNPRHAQLIFTTHNTNLLSADLFRRDQVWFVEKSRHGASDLYSLLEYRVDGKIIRNDASFEKDYVLGRYGAIPYISDLQRLKEAPDAAPVAS